MPYPMRLLAALTVTCAITLAAVAAPATPRGESESILAAENALRDGDCRGAAENYLAAAKASAEVSVATRATQLAVGCEQLATARAAAARWRQLAPYSGDAALAAALVALKRYDLDEARSALIAWRESGSSGNTGPVALRRGAAAGNRRDRPAPGLRRRAGRRRPFCRRADRAGAARESQPRTCAPPWTAHSARWPSRPATCRRRRWCCARCRHLAKTTRQSRVHGPWSSRRATR